MDDDYCNPVVIIDDDSLQGASKYILLITKVNLCRTKNIELVLEI